jgi:hypothetical protein
MKGNHMKRLRTLCAVLIASFFGVACSSTQTLTLVSTKNVDLSANHDVVARAEKRSEGRFWLLFIPFASEPNALRVTTKLLNKHKGDYLTNVAVKKTGWSLLVVSWGSVMVKGDVFRRVDQPVVIPVAEPSLPEPSAAEPGAETGAETSGTEAP